MQGANDMVKSLLPTDWNWVKSIVWAFIVICIVVLLARIVRHVLVKLFPSLEGLMGKMGYANYPFIMRQTPWTLTSALPGMFIGDQVAFGNTAQYTMNDGAYQDLMHNKDDPADQSTAEMARVATMLSEGSGVKSGMCAKANFGASFKDGNQFLNTGGFAKKEINSLDENALVAAMHGDA